MTAGLQLDCRERPDAALLAEWDAFHAQAAHQHPHQTPRAAPAEEAIGRKALYVTGRAADGAIRATGLFTLQPHGWLRGAWEAAWCLSGPVCDEAALLADFLDGVARLPAFRRVGRLRVTPYWTGDEARDLQALLAARGWRPTEINTFRTTGLVDLSRSPEEIFARLSKSARREVRRAERQGVTQRFLQGEDEARQFFESVCRLHQRRGMAPVPEGRFIAEFENFTPDCENGAVVAAFYDGQLIAGLQLICSHTVVHIHRFASEPELLHKLGNLRISPFVGYHGMLWARGLGCRYLDVEGWREDAAAGDLHYSIYKYKGEFSPEATIRIGEHSRAVSPLLDLVSNPKGRLLLHARRLRRRLR